MFQRRRTGTYQQIKDILDSVRQLHRELREHVEDSFGDTDSERSHFLIKSIRETEEEMDQALASYEQSKIPAILNLWVQFVPHAAMTEFLYQDENEFNELPTDVMAWKLQFDMHLMDFYTQMTKEVSSSKAKEMFEQLSAMISRRLVEQSWNSRDFALMTKEEKKTNPS